MVLNARGKAVLAFKLRVGFGMIAAWIDGVGPGGCSPNRGPDFGVRFQGKVLLCHWVRISGSGLAVPHYEIRLLDLFESAAHRSK
jgi:hypothetical protein